MPERLENQVAIVTGGASGIGRGIARLFVMEGASPHIAPRAAMIAPDFALLRVLATASIAPPMVDEHVRAEGQKTSEGAASAVCTRENSLNP